MLRLLVVALLLFNLLFFGWSMGWLDTLTGVPAQGDRDPGRMAREVHPERLTLLGSGAAGGSASDAASAPAGPAGTDPAAEAAASEPSDAAVVASASPVAPARPATGASRVPAAVTAAAAASASPAASSASGGEAGAAAATACLEAGPFVEGDLAGAVAALQARVPEGWAERRVETGEWMIYMGPYPDAEWMARKKAELGRIRGGITYTEVTAPAELARGLSLGRFPSQAAANTTLAQYRLRGIRTARVVRAGPGPTRTWLRFAEADRETAATLSTLRLPPGNRAFGRCAG